MMPTKTPTSAGGSARSPAITGASTAVAVAASDVNIWMASVTASARGRRSPHHRPGGRTISASVTIASTVMSCGPAGTRSTICTWNAPAMRGACGGEERQQAVVVAAAVAEPPSRPVERDAGHQHPVDGRGRHRGAMRQRLGNALMAGRDVANAGRRSRGARASAPVALTRGTATVLPAASAARTSGSVSHSLRNGSVSSTVRAATNDGSAAMRAAIVAAAAARTPRRERVARREHLPPQRELRLAQRRALRRRVGGGGFARHPPMLTQRAPWGRALPQALVL